MDIYDNDGWLDMEKVMRYNFPITVICGGRGTGKTFGILRWILAHGEKFMLSRRTEKETKKIADPLYSPFKSVLDKNPQFANLEYEKKDDMGVVYAVRGDEREVIGYIMSLIGIADIRGMDTSDVKIWVYDEFIPEKHKRNIRDESTCILQAFETIGRNRELEGKPPLRLVALANSNRVDNALFEAFGLINIAQDMSDGKRAPVYANTERGILLIFLEDSPISKRKRNTVLYKAAAIEGFTQMALDNDFPSIDSSRIKSMPLGEFRPLASCGELNIYRHKSNNIWYISGHRSGHPMIYSNTDTDIARMRDRFSSVWFNYIEQNNVYFENTACLVLFEKLFK